MPAEPEHLRRSLARSFADLLDGVEARDGHGHRHARRVAQLANAVADRLGICGDRRATLQLGAYLHDVGKLAVAEQILRKPGPLTAEEWETMRTHAAEGERLLAPTLRAAARLLPGRCAEELLAIIRAHHERWDGKGYPDGARGDEIPLGARIVAVCDAYEAMTEGRVYRSPVRRDAALEELLRHAGAQWDPRCVDALVGVVTDASPLAPTLAA